MCRPGVWKLCGRWNGRAENWTNGSRVKGHLWTICLPFSHSSPPSPLLFLPQTNRNPSRVERESLREKFPLPFLFFFFLIQFILYRNPVTKRERLVYSNNRIFSKQDSGVDRESFEYSSVNFTVTGLRSRMYNSSAGLKLELFRFFPAIFFFRSLVKKNDESRSDPHLRFNIHIHD